MAAMFSTRPRRNEEFCGEHHLHHLQLVKYIIGLVVSEEKISKSETRLSNGFLRLIYGRLNMNGFNTIDSSD
jgi:hypothetical protein